MLKMMIELNGLDEKIRNNMKDDKSYFHHQVFAVFTNPEIRNTDKSLFRLDDVNETNKTTKSGVKYMNIARFLICNMDMGVFFDYDNKTHSDFIYEGLDNNPETAELIAEVYNIMTPGAR